ncbi:MAG: DivIVA domain-containing protein [Deltaproteobacteria bacterium]|nr:MAG: DivIVA domain-containing protein [Deltaproteobacteria bacterium]
MKITPLDIQQQQFKVRFRGFDQRDVEAFLELVRNEFEVLIKENNSLKDKLRRRDEQIARYRDDEQTLKETMITAQKINEDIKTNAIKESEVIVSEAKLKAQEILNSAQLRSLEILEEIKELKRQKIQFESNLRANIETHLKMLEAETKKTEEIDVLEEKLEILKRK